MKISSRLTFAVLVPVIMAVIVLILLTLSFQSMQNLLQKGSQVRQIRDCITNLNGYVHSYILYHEDRPRQQFEAEYNALSEQLNSVYFRDSEQQSILENIRNNAVSMNESFNRLVSNYQFVSQGESSSSIRDADARLQGIILTQSRNGAANVSVLRELLDEDLRSAQIRTISLILAVIFLLTIPVTFILLRMRKGITSSLAKLSLGAETVGSGNLAYRINLPSKDELGDLARSFDGMAEKLQTITVSREALQGEVEERKKAQEALWRGEQRWATTLASIGDAVIATDTKGMVTFMNAVAENLTGWNLKEANGRPVTEIFNIINEYSRQEVENPVDKVLQTGMIVGLANHTLLVRKDGTTIPIDDSGAPIKAYKGQTTGVVLVFRDISERKKAEEALKRYTNELETTNMEMESFSYSVSHDLRAPLRTLGGFSEMVIQDYGDRLDETGKDYLSRIRKASQTMSQLIDDILKLSRISRAEMHQERINLTSMVHSIVNELKAAQPGRQVELTIAPELSVRGDRSLLQIALRNLLDNAWKYTGQCKTARIEFGMIQQNEEKVYFVRDNGIGFDMKLANKLFQPFQRLHTSKEYPGTGIGLATVQRVIRRHGGRIYAESEPGKGTTFYFTLGAY